MCGALGLLTALLGLASCTSPNAHLRPVRPPEEYKIPPDNDPRYNQPIEYPKEAMEKDPLQKKGGPNDPNAPGNGPGGMPGGMRPSTPGGRY
jgi:hypothetical protein